MEELLNSVIQGRFDFFRSSSQFSPLPFAAFHEESDRFYYASGIDYAYCNGVLEKNNDAKLSEKEIDLALQFFKPKKIPFIWWSNDPLLEKKGFHFGGVLKGVRVDTQSFSPLLLPKGWEIREVKEEIEMKQFCRIVIEVFGMDSHTYPQFLASQQSAADAGQQMNFLAFVDDKPVATMTLATSPQSAGLWNGATIPPFRKQGISTALMHRALDEAKKRSYSQTMALLMPEGMAAGLCKKERFQEVCDFPFYVYSGV